MDRFVSLNEIRVQRAMGWPDFHPEDYCHRCGRLNMNWWVDSDLFNEALGYPEGIDPEWQGIICPQCFDELSPLATTWRLVPRQRDVRDDPIIEPLHKAPENALQVIAHFADMLDLDYFRENAPDEIQRSIIACLQLALDDSRQDAGDG